MYEKLLSMHKDIGSKCIEMVNMTDFGALQGNHIGMSSQMCRVLLSRHNQTSCICFGVVRMQGTESPAERAVAFAPFWVTQHRNWQCFRYIFHIL